MGYTHYWRFGAFIGEKEYKKALQEIRKLVKASPIPLANGMGDEGTKPEVGATVSFNGVGEDAHETFLLRKDPILVATKPDRYPSEEFSRFNFCKTAQKPYDVVVVACLCVLQERLGKSIEVSSDGDAEEWEDGRVLAEKVLGRSVKTPVEVKPRAVREREYQERRAKEQAARG